MRRRIILLLIVALCACAQSPEPPSVTCALYYTVAKINFDEMSPQGLQEWVELNYPDATIESRSIEYGYDESYTWYAHQHLYTAHYRDGRLLYIDFTTWFDFPPEQQDTPQEVIACLGEPTHYTAASVPGRIVFTLLYPERGVRFRGGLDEPPNSQNYEAPVIFSVIVQRPTTNLEQFTLDVAREPEMVKMELIRPWEGWENMEVVDGVELLRE